MLLLPVIAGLLFLFPVRKNRVDSQQGCFFTGLVVIFFVQVLLIAVAILSWRGAVDPRLALPPLERAATSMSLVWLVWIWGFLWPSLKFDLPLIFFNLTILGLYLLNIFLWNALAETRFYNGSALDWAWLGLWLLLSSAGLGFQFVRRPAGWGLRSVFFIFFLTGTIFQILSLPIPGDYPHFVRAAQLCAFVFLPWHAVLTLRNSYKTKKTIPHARIHPETAPETPRSETGAAWDDLARKDGIAISDRDIPRVIAASMGAEACFLVSQSKDAGKIDFQNGYDRLKDEEIPFFSVGEEEIPNLAAALENQRGLQWENDDATNSNFAARFHPFQTGGRTRLLFTPIKITGEVNWGILLLSSQPGDFWSAADRAALVAISKTLGKIVPHPSEKQQNVARVKVENSEENIPEKPAGISETQYASQIEGLISVQRDLQSIIENLQNENDQLRSSLRQQPILPPEDEKTADNRGLESELKLTLKEVAHLQNALADANLKIMALQAKSPSNLQALARHESPSALINDIRKSIVSITGYCDLLLTESVGILGDLQKKFIERIRNFVTQITPLLTRLEQEFQTSEKSSAEIPGGAEVKDILDACISDITNQIRKKNIALCIQTRGLSREKYPHPENLKKIVDRLLQNACDTTPVEGEVDLITRHEPDENGSPRLSIVVSDSSGGAGFENIQKTFSQVRQTGEDTSHPSGWIDPVRRLVETEGGRIWAECEQGKGVSICIELHSHHPTAAP